MSTDLSELCPLCGQTVSDAGDLDAIVACVHCGGRQFVPIADTKEALRAEYTRQLERHVDAQAVDLVRVCGERDRLAGGSVDQLVRTGCSLADAIEATLIAMTTAHVPRGILGLALADHDQRAQGG